jgi:hypothetical protein
VKTNDSSVIQTGTTFTNFNIEENLTISMADKAGKLFRKMSPRFRMRVEVWLLEDENNGNFAKDDIWQMIKTLQRSPHSIATVL